MPYNENAGTFDARTLTGPVEVPIATPSSTSALLALADAAQMLAKASEDFIRARGNLNEARSRYDQLQNEVSKAREQDGV